MAEYGPGLTLAKCFSYDKDRIKHALKGELMCGEDENGFTYATATKDECDAYIVNAFDNAVHQALRLADSGRAMETVLAKKGIGISLTEYMDALEVEELRFRGQYEYEYEED